VQGAEDFLTTPRLALLGRALRARRARLGSRSSRRSWSRLLRVYGLLRCRRRWRLGGRQLCECRVHAAQDRGGGLLVGEELVLGARGVDVGRERAVAREEERAGNVAAVGRPGRRALLLLVLVDVDHHELLRLLDDLGIVEDLAVVRAVRAPLG